MKIVIHVLTNCKLCAYVQNGDNSESNDLLGLTLRVKPAPIILDKNAIRQSTKMQEYWSESVYNSIKEFYYSLIALRTIG